MPRSVPGTLKLLGWMIYDELNWFRIHLLAFIIVPFIFSGFVVAANPSSPSERRPKTQYIDSLFLCFSAMTGTGLETVNVSGMRPLQQVFLVILMMLGDISVISLITIFCRQLWFRRNCKSAVKTKRLSRPRTREDVESRGDTTSNGPVTRPGVMTSSHHQVSPSSNSAAHPVPRNHSPIMSGEEQYSQLSHRKSGKRRKKEGIHAYPGAVGYDERERLRRRARGLSDDVHEVRHHSFEMPKTYSVIPHAASGSAAHTGRGGFPGPHRLVAALIRAISPKTAHQVYTFIAQDPKARSLRWAHPFQSFEQTVDPSFEKRKDAQEARHAEKVKWLPPGVRGVVVGRNSDIYDEELDVEDLELFAAIEYRALTLLTVLLFVHQFLCIILPWIIIAIYFAKVHDWDATFFAKGQEQVGTVSKVWYSLFQSIAAYTSCGMSLVDSSMMPFQACYLLIYILVLPILAGNQAMPSFLRLELWIFSKFITPGSELYVLVHFLLTHSRRMFIYLLPSYQTWWLMVIQTLFIAGGLLSYVVFNIGLEFYKRFSGWQNFSVGLFQSLSIRSAGFEIVELTEIAPALQVLYLFAMFTSNYALVMAIRSTNVYEERALGIHTRHLVRTSSGKPEGEIFSKYVIDHLLPQIAFDLWPIVLATGAICVVERAQLLTGEGSGWFTTWRTLFEVTSGYATVGASFGYPASNLSFSGSFRNISKLIMILLMVRGRHGGLPSAIDRATMLPVEYLRINTDDGEKAEKDRVEVM